jgi:RND family efflux transporter MFP subunit
MDLVPVKTETKEEAASKPAKKTIKYRSTMNPFEISDKPGKDSMSMDMVPFEMAPAQAKTGSLPGLANVTISAEQRQRMNLRLAPAVRKRLTRQLHTSARIVPAENRLYRVTTKIDGYVEKLFVSATGQAVQRGQPLLSIFSPELVASQQEFLSALHMAGQLNQSSDAETVRGGQLLVDAARRRLSLWDISEAQIRRLEQTGRVEKAMILPAPADGYVTEKMVLAGQKIMAGEPLMVVVDLSVVWAEADIYESDAAFVRSGMSAALTLPFLPGKTFSGKISFLNPFLDEMSRTLKARLEIANPDLLLKPEMYGNITLSYDLGERLLIPESALLRSGERSYVFVAVDESSLTPVPVEVGVQSDDDVEVLSGLKEGDMVVVSANFLVDSESSLKAALQAIAGNE